MPRASRRSGDARGDVLIVVDDTDASRRVVEYAGRMLAPCVGITCHLTYIAPPLPPALLESGGAELPEREVRVEAELRRKQHRWTATVDRKAERVLGAARMTLQRAGISKNDIATYTSSPLEAAKAADVVLRLAREQACGTVVVGHRAHSWLQRLGGGDLAEQLVRRAKGLTVWVVG